MCECNIYITVLLNIVIPCLSIIISIIALCNTNKLNSVNSNLHYYHNIFDDYLKVKFPEAYRMLRFDSNDRLESFGELQLTIESLRLDSEFFKFFKEKFYNELCKRIEKLEDELAVIINSKVCKEKQSETFNTIKEQYKKIYECIRDGSLK